MEEKTLIENLRNEVEFFRQESIMYRQALLEVCFKYCRSEYADDEIHKYGAAPLYSKGDEVLEYVMSALGIDDGAPESEVMIELGIFD